ncbi:MAG TPA: FtsX-like permease family protein [Limnochordales bacterium]
MGAFWIRLRRNWFRNLLAMGQVALAIAAVTAVLADVVPALRASSAEERVPFTVRFGVREGFATMWESVYTPEDAAWLQAEAESVAAATWFRAEVSSAIRVGEQHYVVRGQGYVDLGFAETMGLRLVAGSYFTPADMETSQPRVALVSEQLAQVVFGTTDVVGRVINVRPAEEARALRGFAPPGFDRASALAAPGLDVEIIGVFALPPGLPYLGFPNTAPMELLLPVPAGEATGLGSEGELLLLAKPGMEQMLPEEVRTLLSARIAGRPKASEPLNGRMPEVLVDQGMSLRSLRQAQLQGIQVLGAMSMAALVVSGIAMFTTTLANLAQRTRYIGLSRALGATRLRVVREAVAEAAFIAGLGGVAGVLGGYPVRQLAVAPLMQGLASTPVEAVDVVIVGVIGVLLAMAVGAAAAVYPAWTVARLAPAEAWREGRL